MALYIVVHHNRDAHQPWQNSWLDDDRLEAIQTTREIGRLCETAAIHSEEVFVHRCAWGETQPTICCSLRVDSVDLIDKKASLVKFRDFVILGNQPPLSPSRGQNFYKFGP